MFQWKKHAFVLLLTSGIFLVAFLFSNYLFNSRMKQVSSLESTINQSILESEIQYMLLADSSCEQNDGAKTLLLEQLNNLAERLEYLESQRGDDDIEVLALKKQYSLLEVKDYLLLRERDRRCNKESSPSILYFYTNNPEADCTDCKKMEYILTSMRKEYDTLHIYSFDYNLELSTVETLKSIYNLEDVFPIIVINREPYYGFKTREEIEELLPNLPRIEATSTDAENATSTKK